VYFVYDFNNNNNNKNNYHSKHKKSLTSLDIRRQLLYVFSGSKWCIVCAKMVKIRVRVSYQNFKDVIDFLCVER